MNHVFYLREKELGGQEPTDIKTSIRLETQDYTLNNSCQRKVVMKIIRFFISTLVEYNKKDTLREIYRFTNACIRNE